MIFMQKSIGSKNSVFTFWGQSTENYVKMVTLRCMCTCTCGMLHACERSVCLDVVQSVHVCGGGNEGMDILGLSGLKCF